jgi:hypothetical protein
MSQTEASTELVRENADLKAMQQHSFEATIVKNPVTLQDYMNIAKTMAASGFFPDASNAAKAVGLMVLGSHFGLSPVQSMTAIHVVKGKPMLHYSAILAKVRQHPDYDYRILEATETIARIEFRYKGEVVGESSFTIEEAKKRQTQNLDKFPKVMLMARAASQGVRFYCPDVLNGVPVYTEGELDEPEAYADAPKTRKESLVADIKGLVKAPDVVEPEPPDEPGQELLIGEEL